MASIEEYCLANNLSLASKPTSRKRRSQKVRGEMLSVSAKGRLSIPVSFLKKEFEYFTPLKKDGKLYLYFFNNEDAQAASESTNCIVKRMSFYSYENTRITAYLEIRTQLKLLMNLDELQSFKVKCTFHDDYIILDLPDKL